MSEAEIRAIIIDAFPEAEVKLMDLAGDNDHWAAHITSPRFAGLSRVAQHKLVYAAFGDIIGGRLHALRLTTAVPATD